MSMRATSENNGATRRAGRMPLRRFGIRIAGLAVVAFALTMPAAAAATQLPSDAPPPSTPLEQVQALVQPAVVYEEITWSAYVYDRHNHGYFNEDSPFTVSFQCTGFIVNPDGYVATAGHCADYDQTVKDAILTKAIDFAYDTDYYAAKPSKATIATFSGHWRIDGQSTKGRPDQKVSVAYGVSVSGEPSGKALPARVVGLRPFDQGDVALLKIEAKDLTVVPLSDNSNTGVGTQIVSIGYPASVDLVTDANFNPSFKEGSISAEKTTEGGLLPVYEISAAVSGGMSGGPTASLDGQIIGVNSFKITGETQPFNFVQPSQTMEELLRSEGVENTLGQVTDLYRRGLAAYFAGDRDASIAAFDQVLEIVPSHQFAQEYKRKAQSLPASASGLSSPAVRIGLLLGIIVVIIVVVAIIILLRRRGSSGPEPALAAAATTDRYGPAPPTAQGAAASAPPVFATAQDVTDPPPPPPPIPPPPPPTTVFPQTEVPPPPPPAEVSPAVAESSPPAADSPAAGEVEDDLFCPNCGRQHPADARFCPHCGKVLT